jgi:parvulin-like peptidyl-prolyl isomerase
MNLESIQTKDKSKVRMAVVDQLIDEYILLLEAKNRGFSVSDEEIEKLIEFNIETAAIVQNEEFNKYLDNLGMTTEDYYRDYTYVTLKEKLLENKLNDDITKEEESPEQKVKKWNAFKEKLISDFRKKNDEEIKKLINMVEQK